MNLKKLTALLFAGVTAAAPFATNAQNPTILQGNYISNVFGQANFVLNPNAQTNVANVTLTNATATRSTTTPLVATTEWNVTVTSANGTAAWATRSFDAGMKNQNCEARFSYRGFQATSKAQIKQGANVVAELVLTPSATDPRIASINFPCGDLSSATTFVITDTATLAGTNEIGGIYVGLATNQANVAQAEFIGSLRNRGTSACTWLGLGATQMAANSNCNIYEKNGLDLQPATHIPAIELTAQKSGNYQIDVSGYFSNSASLDTKCELYQNNVAINSIARTYQNPAVSSEMRQTISFNKPLTAGTFYKFDIRCDTNDRLWARDNHAAEWLEWSVARFPSSSELVVTPETQNVWGGVTYRGPADVISLFSGAAASSTYTTYNDATWSSYRDFKNSRCEAPISANNVGCQIKNLPVGSYKVTFSGLMYERMTAPTDVTCSYKIQETVTSSDVAYSTNKSFYTDGGVVWNGRTLVGTFRNTSVGDRNFVIQAAKTTDSSGTTGRCELYVGTTGGDRSDFNIVIEPLDNNSNSALYVQGPVKAAATGTAIPAGYQFYNQTGSQISGSFAASGVWSSISSVTLDPGLWEVEAICQMRSNTSTCTTPSYVELSISNNNTNEGTDTDLFSNTYRQPTFTTCSRYDHIRAKLVRYITVTTTRYINHRMFYSGGIPTYSCQTRIKRLN